MNTVQYNQGLRNGYLDGSVMGLFFVAMGLLMLQLLLLAFSRVGNFESQRALYVGAAALDLLHWIFATAARSLTSECRLWPAAATDLQS